MDSEITPTSPRSLARRQAALAALTAFLSSLLVGFTVLNVASRDVRRQVEDRFIALANERERQIESLVRQEYRSAAMAAADVRWPTLIAGVRSDPPDPRAEAEARRLLRTAASVGPGYERIDVVSDGRILVSTEDDLTGEPPDYLAETVPNRQMLTPPFNEGGQVFTLVTAPIAADPPATLIAKADAQPFVEVLRDTTPLGLGGSLSIVPADSGLLARLQDAAGTGTSTSQGLTELETQLGEMLVYWKPVRFNPGEGDRWRFVASLPTAEAYAPLTRLRQWLLAVGVPLTLLVTATAYLAARRLNRRLSALTRRARRIAATGQTDLDDEPLVHGPQDELGALVGAFDAMGRRVGADLQAARDDAEREREARSRLMAELALAREVQSRLYPGGPLCIGRHELTGFSEPAEELCGDYFDYFACDRDGCVYFALGDVSGHGVGPSLMMVEVRSILRSLRNRPQPLCEFVSRLNDQLTEESPADRFVSLFLGRLEPDSGEVEYIGAGHRGLLVRQNGEVETLASTGMLIGLFAGVTYRTASTRIGDGDLLCVVSDGLEETDSPVGQTLGWVALSKLIGSHRGLRSQDLIKATLADCDRYAGGVPPRDDRTLLVVRRGSQ